MKAKWFTCRVYNVNEGTERNVHVIAHTRSKAMEKCERLLPIHEILTACWVKDDKNEERRILG